MTDNDTTLRETLAIVIAKMANKLPMTNEKEEFCEKVISEWSSKFGFNI